MRPAEHRRDDSIPKHSYNGLERGIEVHGSIPKHSYRVQGVLKGMYNIQTNSHYRTRLLLVCGTFLVGLAFVFFDCTVVADRL